MGGISIWNLLIIAVIVVLLFGTNKLRTLGSDLGASIKGFKKAMGDDASSADKADKTQQDADFATKSIAEPQPEVKPDETKSQHKEQV
ncbi:MULTISPECIES: Sec-independent protein translocase subunit TatA [Brenneria]|uniref:Sec-independent protein translocase protein TatA n=1 Tax=Brenneria nigrifluens DSM 30175 = ATCC 13028 TaxID=1121120 RepID=A0A2U1UNH3_9GAMM|nr:MULTISPECIES: Sec-independent protein translocase subunit TatA [Brenneria]EHD19672.1 Sec-independent protein translocase protein tatA/E-like protein [Brenneria sp. EniD312]PWC23233.1 twin-arginine translocase TatA/TatE family subunit [Brenneria nigrifluens DSM 30175 = ATCC 13028]QCR02935.1 Sec-independent protein translocase subunit TatA [Brenneria nigrifluens DSM 30175 = ATCC 13028]